MGRGMLAVMALVLLLGAACTPKAAPPPPPPATATAPPVSSPATPSPQPSEWDGVIAAAKKEGRLTAYSFHLVGGVGLGIAQAFKDKYGIEIETISGPGMQLIERIKSEKRAGQGLGDILTTASSIIFAGKTEGLTQSVGKLPVFGEQGVWYGDPRLDTEANVISFLVTMFPVVSNTNLVKPAEEPTSWTDLLDPKWKGKIVLADPAIIPNAVYVYIALLKTKAVDKEYFARLGKQDLKIVSTVRDLAATVARGEAALSFASSTTTTAPLAKQGAPVKSLDMKEGIPVAQGSGLAMLAGSPHPNASRLFVNWLLSQEGQATYVKLDPSISIRKDVPDVLPAGVRMTPKLVLTVTPPDELETSRIMREKELSKLLGR